MIETFKIKRTMYIILLVVFIVGMMIEVARSNTVLQFNPFAEQAETFEPISLPESLTSTLDQETFLLLKNPDSEISVQLSANISQTLAYMQKEVEEIQASGLPESLTSYSGIIITFEDVSLFEDFWKIEEYVNDGGSVFFALRPGLSTDLTDLYGKIGIAEPGVFGTAHGIEFLSNLLIKNKGLVMESDFLENSSLTVKLKPETKIHMKSVNHIPLLWDVSFGKGRFVVFNGTMLLSKNNRGLLTGAISLMKEDMIYPIFNMKLAYIDDFPAPFPKGVNKDIFEEYGLDIEDFYRNIWWPSIQKGAAKYDLKYSGYLIQTYNDRVQGPFETNNREQYNMIKYGRELLKMNGELGIHGYNHQSLITDVDKVADLGYNAWGNKEDMVEALKQVSKFVQDVYPAVTMQSYVPPSNIIDETGLAALQETIPSIKVISSLYLAGEAGRSFVQEYTLDETFIHLPRLTSGYKYTDMNKWTIANALTSIGVFSHFIHPDDILDKERAYFMSWEELSKEYDGMLHSINTEYPWLKSRTATEAGNWLKHMLNTEIYMEKKEDQINVYIDEFPGIVYFILRTDKKVTDTKECTVDKIDNGVYLVTAKKEIIKIGLGE
ncbi:DUF2194 domain-containing protein [Cytobacillus suaedae]|nr:DUF2194 domain-containing protein [Cytobacillus suaedae]